MSIQGNFVGGIIPTAEQVGARPNTWMPTSVDVGAAPAIEDATYAGCYYRMVGGEKEWINPPMFSGVEYLTTDRYEGSLVYRQRRNLHGLPSNSNKVVELGIDCRKIIRSTIIATNNNLLLSLPFMDNDGLLAHYAFDKDSVNIVTNSAVFAGYTGAFIDYWYIK